MVGFEQPETSEAARDRRRVRVLCHVGSVKTCGTSLARRLAFFCGHGPGAQLPQFHGPLVLLSFLGHINAGKKHALMIPALRGRARSLLGRLEDLDADCEILRLSS